MEYFLAILLRKQFFKMGKNYIDNCNDGDLSQVGNNCRLSPKYWYIKKTAVFTKSV